MLCCCSCSSPVAAAAAQGWYAGWACCWPKPPPIYGCSTRPLTFCWESRANGVCLVCSCARVHAPHCAACALLAGNLTHDSSFVGVFHFLSTPTTAVDVAVPSVLGVRRWRVAALSTDCMEGTRSSSRWRPGEVTYRGHSSTKTRGFAKQNRHRLNGEEVTLDEIKIPQGRN